FDAAGKDGVIRTLARGLDPAGFRVVSFRKPNETERAHDFLWRAAAGLPALGEVVVFNRSHYEGVLAERLHPELVADLPGFDPAHEADFFRRRFGVINAWEAHLHDSGIQVIKVWLDISAKEQRRRLLARLDNPHRQWKFDA